MSFKKKQKQKTELAHFVGKIKNQRMLSGGWWGEPCSHPPWPLQESWFFSPPGMWAGVLGLEMRVWRAERNLTMSFGPAPAFGQARQSCHDFIEEICRGWGSGEDLQSWLVAETSGHLQEIPWPLPVPLPLSETVGSEPVTMKTRLALSAGSVFFSLTYDRFHHMLSKKKMQGRTADKFMSTANCLVIYLFHKWLLRIHCPQSPCRQSGLSTHCGTQRVCGWLLLTWMIVTWKPQNIAQENTDKFTPTLSEKTPLLRTRYFIFVVSEGFVLLSFT